MKGKMDAEKLKELCLNNFEKVIFGVLVLVFILMVASALKVKSYSKKPEQLSSLCNQAKTKLEEVQEVKPVVRSFDSIVTGIQEHLPDTDYVTAVSWNPILSKESQKRKSPRIFTVQNLQVKEWHGSVQKPQRNPDEMMEEEPEPMDDGFGVGGGMAATTDGVRCCVLIGELPLADQELEYQRKLGVRGLSQMQRGGMEMMSASSDSPMYYNYAVERALVPADGDLSKIKDTDWVDLRKKQGKKLSVNEEIIRKYAGGELGRGSGGMDIPEIYAPPSLWRYPSLTDDPKTGSKTGSKTGTKTATNRMNPRAAGMMMDPMGGMMQNGLVASKDASLMVPLPQVSSSSNQMQFNWNTYLPYPEGFEIDMMMNGRRVRKRAADGTAENAGNTKNAENGNAEEADAEDEEAGGDDEENDEELEAIDDPMMDGGMMEEKSKIRLFRYVDYTVEEGKQYIYRVKVQLHNPNYQYDPPFNVENPDDRKGKYLESAWSEVSRPVSIPLDNHFYLAGFRKKFTRDTKERKLPQYLSLMPVRFNETTGYEDFTYFNSILDPSKNTASKSKKKKVVKKEAEQRLEPGQLLNLFVDELEIRQLGNMERGMQAPRRRYGDEDEEDKQLSMFKTNFILLDVRGGQELYEPLSERDLEGAAQEIRNDPDGVYAPSMVLLMGPKGDLVIQSELEDVPDVYRRRDPAEANRMMEDMMQRPEDSMGMDSNAKGSKRRNKKDSMDRLGGERPPKGERLQRSGSRGRL